MTHAEGVCHVVCVILLGPGHLEGIDCSRDRGYAIPGIEGYKTNRERRTKKDVGRFRERKEGGPSPPGTPRHRV